MTRCAHGTRWLCRKRGGARGPVGEGSGQGHGVSKSWLYELLARHRQGGEEGLAPRSKRPLSSPRRVRAELEEEVVALRKSLAEEGLDAGAHTIQYHLLARRKGRPGPSALGVLHLEGAGPERVCRPPAPQAAP